MNTRALALSVFVVASLFTWGSMGIAAELTASGPETTSTSQAKEKALTMAAYCIHRGLDFKKPVHRYQWRGACRELYGTDDASVVLDSAEQKVIDDVMKEFLERETRSLQRLAYCLNRAGDIKSSKDAVLFARACEITEEEYWDGKIPEPTYENAKVETDDVVAIENGDCAALSSADIGKMCFQDWWDWVRPQLLALIERDYPAKVERMKREYQQCFETMRNSKERLLDCIKVKWQALYTSYSAPTQPAPDLWDRIAAALMGFGAGFQGNNDNPVYSPSVGGYSYPSSSTPPGLERDLDGNLRAQTPYGSNQFFDRQQLQLEQRQIQQQQDFKQQWQDLQRRTERQRQGGRWCQGDC